MITTYASFNTTAYPANILLTMAARDDAAPLATGTPVLMQIMVKTAAQTWDTAGLYPMTLELQANAVHLAHTALAFPFNSAAFTVRSRAHATVWSDWVEVSYTAPAVEPLQAPRSRFVTYKSVQEGFLRRRGTGSSNPPSADDLTDAAEFISSAYRYCLETWAWPDATITRWLNLSNGFLSWPCLFGADNAEFWTADPDAPCSLAVPIRRLRHDNQGLHLDTKLTSIFARFTPRPPEFKAQPVVPATRYGYGDIVYHAASGNMYEVVTTSTGGALGSDIEDRSQWRSLQLLWLLADTTKLLAMADALGNGEHERAQAADLREQVETKLTQLVTHAQMNLPPPQ